MKDDIIDAEFRVVDDTPPRPDPRLEREARWRRYGEVVGLVLLAIVGRVLWHLWVAPH